MALPAQLATEWNDWHDQYQDTISSIASPSRQLLQTSNSCHSLDEARYADKVTHGRGTLDHSPDSPRQRRYTGFQAVPESPQLHRESRQSPDGGMTGSMGWSPKSSVRDLQNSHLQTAKLPMPAPANELSFMGWYPSGEAIISFHTNDGRVDSIPGINIWIIESCCPLLAAAFEESRSGPQLFLESLSPATAAPFVRYLYTGSYAVPRFGGDGFEDVPTSILLHCSMFHLGDLYDIDELKTQAYVNVFRQCEFGCSSPDQPIDLCSAIRYAYEHLRKHENLIDAIIHYCVSCFSQHRLAEDPKFRELAYELRPFHQDLCSKIRDQGFQHDTAAAIIQLPFKIYTSQMMFEDSPRLKKFASAPEPQINHATPADGVDGVNVDEEDESPSRKRKRHETSTETTNALMSNSDNNQFDLPFRLVSKGKERYENDARQDKVTQIAKKRRASVAETEATEEVYADEDTWFLGSSVSADQVPRDANERRTASPDWYEIELEEASGSNDRTSPAGVQDRDDSSEVEPDISEVASNFDFDFEFVEAAAATDTPSSEGEWGWPDPCSEIVHATNGGTACAVPFRLRDRAGSTGDAESSVSESESDDWSLV